MMLLEHTLILVRLLLELTKVFVNGDQGNLFSSMNRADSS